MSENCAETHQSCRLAPDWKGHRPLLMGTGYGFRRRPAKNLVGIEAIAVCYREPEAKMEIPAKDCSNGKLRLRAFVCAIGKPRLAIISARSGGSSASSESTNADTK